MEKNKPHCPLSRVKALIEAGKVHMTTTARNGAAALGYDRKRAYAEIMCLSPHEFYKSMIALRRDDRYEDTIVYGVTEPVLEDQKDIMAYFRRGEKQDIMVIGNFRDEAAEVEIPELKGKTCQVLLNNGGTCMAVDGRVKLEALQGVVFEIK